ncbi:MAG TPA: hypothetical protein VJ696_09665 [Rhodanobacteraceae bacterium]|nr:hypothetical protein [Rhodanobacteraceae bacterium]
MRKNLQRCLLGLVVSIGLSSSVSIATAAADGDTVTYTRAFVAGKGSASYADVDRWLRRHDSRPAHFGVDANDNPFEVTITTSARLDPHAKSGPPGPPVGLPQHGGEGDVLTFRRNRTCVDGGGVETWTFEWRSDGGSNGSGGWQLTNYAFSLRGGLACEN